ncbi:hypothetical protein OIU84_026322 [Salix udensis]|uniref:Uncharacterized protein n=1 Tax=Salix udensis TaxID=889485 RepID=A0AAD6KLL5_9ROSI|nr:hypothetical protein OIU84_026322 [Salix udensis]
MSKDLKVWFLSCSLIVFFLRFFSFYCFQCTGLADEFCNVHLAHCSACLMQ